MARIRILLDQSLIKAYIKESHCCSFLLITLNCFLQFSIPIPIFLSKHKRSNLRRYLDVYV